MRGLATILLVVILLLLGESEAGSPSHGPGSGDCELDEWPQTWAFSASNDWVVWTCRYAGAGLVDDFSLHTRVFIVPASSDGSAPRSLLARDWSVAPTEDVLWYIDEAGIVRRLLFSEVGGSLTGQTNDPSPGLDISDGKPWPIFALSSSAAVVALWNDEGPRSICTVRDGEEGTELVECTPSPAELRWTEGSAVSASAFVIANRVGDCSYSIEYWEIGPLARRWVRDLPIGVEPRGILAGEGGDFLIVGCASEAPNPPFLSVLDSEGGMEIVEPIAESCVFGLFNPCPAVVGGTWKDGKWRIWLEPGPSGDDLDELLEEMHVDSNGAECFPEARPNGAQPADSKAQ